MSFLDKLISIFPEVTSPTEKKLSFKVKLKWTAIILGFFFILGLIPVAGLDPGAKSLFEDLAVILAASFGSILSLGIGPIVTASIILQLLNGSGIIKFDTSTHEGKKRFQGIQKLLSITFIVVESIIFVFLGGLGPAAGVSHWFIILQLFIGGLMIMFMDEVINKWGFGSGISLFIAAGVSKEIFLKAFSWVKPAGSEYSVGAVWQIFQTAGSEPTIMLLAIASILATVVVFVVSVFAQSMKVELPLSFGRVRGYGVRWPLNFLYTSNMPVILVAALMANIQIVSNITGWRIGQLFTQVNLIEAVITGSLSWNIGLRALFYISFMMVGSAVFAIFWVQTAGMDSKSQAKQILSAGLQIPGFRKDARILERILDRYIWPLAITGGLAVGILAAFADLMGALSRGTGILLTVMIVYKLYEEIAQQHMMDMNPLMRKFMGK